MKFRNPLILLAIFSTALAGPHVQAQDSQSSQPSLADAARKARAEQKAQPKSAKVYTDDDLANLKGQISIVGSEPPAPTEANGEAAKPADTTKEPVKDEAYWKKRFAAARRTLADDQREQDVLQREYGLKQVQYYQSPTEALREQYSRKDLDDTLAELNAKKADVDKDNQAISDLQDQLRQAGGEPGWADAPTSNAQAGSESSSSDASQASSSQASSSQSSPSDQQNSPAGSATPAPQQPDKAQPSAAPEP